MTQDSSPPETRYGESYMMSDTKIMLVAFSVPKGVMIGNLYNCNLGYIYI